MAAPLGNQYAKGNTGRKREKLISDAVQRELLRDDCKAANEIARVLVERAQAGDMAAIKEVTDRQEGKPAQSITVGGDADAPLQTEMTVKLVRPDAG